MDTRIAKSHGGHFEKWPKWVVHPNFLLATFDILILLGFLNKIIPFSFDQCGREVQFDLTYIMHYNR
jgi:hypothetical protein